MPSARCSPSAGRGRTSCNEKPRSRSWPLSWARVWATPLMSGVQVSLTRQMRMSILVTSVAGVAPLPIQDGRAG